MLILACERVNHYSRGIRHGVIFGMVLALGELEWFSLRVFLFNRGETSYLTLTKYYTLLSIQVLAFTRTASRHRLDWGFAGAGIGGWLDNTLNQSQRSANQMVGFGVAPFAWATFQSQASRANRSRDFFLLINLYGELEWFSLRVFLFNRRETSYLT